MFARATRKTITQTLRELVKEGLQRKRKTKKNGMQALLELAKMAEKEHWSGPKDLSTNHDKYLAEILEKDLKRIHDQYR